MNPESEIVSWNGLVSDIMQNENELVEITLYKLKFEWYVKLVNPKASGKKSTCRAFTLEY